MNRQLTEEEQSPHIIGIHPDQFTLLPNSLLLLWLQELEKPWPEIAVKFSILAHSGYGRRTFNYKGSGRAVYPVELERFEFIVSILRLARLSGRGRPQIREMLHSLAEPVRRAPCNNRSVYCLKGSIQEQIEAHFRRSIKSVTRNLQKRESGSEIVSVDAVMSDEHADRVIEKIFGEGFQW